MSETETCQVTVEVPVKQRQRYSPNELEYRSGISLLGDVTLEFGPHTVRVVDAERKDSVELPKSELAKLLQQIYLERSETTTVP